MFFSIKAGKAYKEGVRARLKEIIKKNCKKYIATTMEGFAQYIINPFNTQLFIIVSASTWGFWPTHGSQSISEHICKPYQYTVQTPYFGGKCPLQIGKHLPVPIEKQPVFLHFLGETTSTYFMRRTVPFSIVRTLMNSIPGSACAVL